MKTTNFRTLLSSKISVVQRTVYLVLLCVTNLLHSQINGKVIDENNQPIPFVNIGVLNEPTGTTSDEDGSFYLPIKDEKIIVFSALGYEKIKIKSNEIGIVKMKSTTYELNEVVILNKKETRQVEIGVLGNTFSQAFENGPKFDAKYFPFDTKAKKNRYIKKISIFTENSLENASVKIHFYVANPDGLPGEELLKKDLIVSVKKGSRRTYFDISNRNISFPKEGLFVSVERLFIEKNKFTKTILNPEGNITKTQTVYYPLLFYNFIERDFSYTFYGGNWHKEYKKSNDETIKSKVFEPAIQLILTN